MSQTKSALSDQVALITGGGSGIGRAVTEGLLDQGVKVIIASRRSELLHKTAGELNARFPKGRVYPYVFDLRDRTQTDRLVAWTISTFGKLDILVNNSGVADHSSILHLEDVAWDYVMETNLRGMMWMIRAVLPHMIERNFGDIINIVSQAGKHGYHDVPAYCASKHAMLGLARSVDDQLRRDQKNVRVFNICPSLVDVVHLAEQDSPREGTMHVHTIVKTVLFCLGLDRNIRLGDLDLLAT